MAESSVPSPTGNGAGITRLTELLQGSTAPNAARLADCATPRALVTSVTDAHAGASVPG